MSNANSPQTSRDILARFNRENRVPEEKRRAVIELFSNSGPTVLEETIERYVSAMDQDRNSDWHDQRPKRPSVTYETLPEKPHMAFETLGIGGMFATLNVLYHAFKHGGKHCIITHPHDIWTFSGWTLHPEEDMDQRLITMYRTKGLILSEIKRLVSLGEGPKSIRFKSFKIDYHSAIKMLKTNPREFAKLLRINAEYVIYQLTDTQHRWARRNLIRNAATMKALREMNRIGKDPDHDFLNMPGRVVFEVEKEPRILAKEKLKEEFGLQGEALSVSDVMEIFGCRPEIVRDMERNAIRAAFYPGGHFHVGFRQNVMKFARELGVATFEPAVAKAIKIDPVSKRHAVTIGTANGKDRTIIADNLLMSLGDYGKQVITVDGISTLFAIRTQNRGYEIHPTGMGEGGNIHIVPVWKTERHEQGARYCYHLGKGTDGAIVGRNPKERKSLCHDEAFFSHLEAHVKKIMPPDGQLIWLAATECGRPVSARQGYSIKTLQPEQGVLSQLHWSAERSLSRSFVASGGCGLGGNTAIIPEVQRHLDSLAEKKKRSYTPSPDE
jgi:glycine/D-amino acid oxidase-like deaminating enzyme